jgi:putative flippase GtrA
MNSVERCLGQANNRASSEIDLPLAAQLFRYLLVGGLAFVVDFATLALLTQLAHLHYLASASVAFLLGMAVNYALSVGWVFKVRAVENPRLELFLFVAIGLVGLCVNELVMLAATQSLHLFYLHAKLIAAAIVLSWNFSARKIILFSAPNASAQGEGAQR